MKLLSQEESGRKVPLIKEWKDLILEMGDKQSLLSSLKENEFFRAFADQGLALEAKMTILDSSIHTLNAIQRKWVSFCSLCISSYYLLLVIIMYYNIYIV